MSCPRRSSSRPDRQLRKGWEINFYRDVGFNVPLRYRDYLRFCWSSSHPIKLPNESPMSSGGHGPYYVSLVCHGAGHVQDTRRASFWGARMPGRNNLWLTVTKNESQGTISLKPLVFRSSDGHLFYQRHPYGTGRHHLSLSPWTRRREAALSCRSRIWRSSTSIERMD